MDVLTSNDTETKLVFLNNGKGQFIIARATWGVAKWSTRNAAVADPQPRWPA